MDTTINSQTPTRTFGFVGLSGLIHLGLLVFVTLFAGEFLHKPEMPAITEIEILSSPKGAAGASEPAPTVTAETVMPAPAEAATPKAMAQTTQAPIAKDDVVVKALKAPKVMPAKLPAKTVTAKTHAQPAPQAARVQTPIHQEVEAPNFETAQLEEAPAVIAPSFDEGMIDEDLAAVDQDTKKQTRAQVQALKAQSEQDEEKLSQSHMSALADLEKQNEDESKRMAALATEQREKEKAALAAAVVAQAAREKAEGEARARAAAAAAKAEAAKVAAAKEGSGSGDGGSSVAGSGGIRGIQDLKQKPGNKRPQYDNDDRFQGRQGQVVFTAYVTKDGNLTNFQIVQSSGHRNLDLKTLKALKDWKFYPGQEGSVEIPFQWDLKGGPQEMPTGLRTKVSQSSRPADLRNN